MQRKDPGGFKEFQPFELIEVDSDVELDGCTMFTFPQIGDDFDGELPGYMQLVSLIEDVNSNLTPALVEEYAKKIEECVSRGAEDEGWELLNEAINFNGDH